MATDTTTPTTGATTVTTPVVTPDSNVISSSSTPPVPTVAPGTAPVDTTDHNATTKSVTQSVIDDYNTYKTQEDTVQGNQNDLGTLLSSLTASEGNKAGDLATATTANGGDQATTDINNYSQQLADLNGQAKALNNEALAIPIQTQERNANTGATDAGVAPQNTSALRNNALKALSIGQQSDIAYAGLTGSQIRLKAAQDKATQMINIKYAPIEAEIASKQQQYNINKDTLDSIDKKRSEALQVSITKEANDVATQKQNEQDIAGIELTAKTNGAPDSVIQAIQSSKDKGSAIAAAGTYLQNKQDVELKQAQIDEAKANIAKIYSDMSSADTSAAANWVTNIKNGTAKITDVPANLKNAVSDGLATSLTGNSVSDILTTTQKSVSDLNDMVTNNNGFSGAVGAKGLSSFFGLKGTPIAGSPAADFDAKLNQVKNDVILPNLTLLHGLGRVTDREFQALTSAVTDLSTNQSEGQFKKSLADITDQINTKLNDAQAATTTGGDQVVNGITYSLNPKDGLYYPKTK